MKPISIFIISIAFCVSICDARILNVPQDHQTIQAGIDAAEAGDTVLVQPGVYDENVVFNQTGVVLGSLILTTGNPVYIDSTIIDGGGRDCVVSISVPQDDGSATLRGFIIRNGGGQLHGGGIDCQTGTNILLEDLIVVGNRAGSSGGGIYTRTGGTFRRIICENNESVEFGGGILFRIEPVLIEDCIIRNNHSMIGGGIAGMGGGLVVTMTLRHTLLAFNSAQTSAACYFYGCELNIDKCTVTLNNATVQGGIGGISILEAYLAPVKILNSIFYDNELHELSISQNGGDNIPRLDYCNIKGGLEGITDFNDIELNWGDGNIDSDPLFVDPDNGDYHLSENSPCIDTGDPDSPRDPDGSRADIGAYYFQHAVPPEIIAHSPEDLDIRVLQGDSVNFAIRGADINGDSLVYQWYHNGEAVSNDTMATVTFDHFGLDSVVCVLTDGQQSDSIQWVIRIVDLYVQSHSPDALWISLPRGSLQRFSLDSIRVAGNRNDVRYQWSLIDLASGKRQLLSREPDYCYLHLPFSGAYSFECLVSINEESSDLVTWSIDVRGAIRNFQPEQTDTGLYPPQVQFFQITPYDLESDSLHYQWYLDGNLMVGATDTISIEFVEAQWGDHFVKAVLTDGALADSVTWRINVWNLEAPLEAQHPRFFAINSLSPNPFNSSTTIRFSVGQFSNPVNIAVYGLDGRLVQQLWTGRDTHSSTEHSVVWNADGLPGGIYLIRLESTEGARISKAVLLK